MRTARFYAARIEPGRMALSDEEAHHARSVLRARIGDRVELFDGLGTVANGVVGTIHRRGVEVDVERIERVGFELRHRIVLAVAVGKTHRQGYLVEKCTELGVAGIWVIRSGRSVARPDDVSAVKWTKRALESCKQSGRAWVPVIEGPFDIEHALGRRGEFAAMALADPHPEGVPFEDLLRRQEVGGSALVWVGPEGGWTEPERRRLIEHGATPVRLAPTVLRTETAAVAVCAIAASLSL